MKWFPILGPQESSVYSIFIIAELLKWTIRCQEMLIWASSECFFSARMWHCVVCFLFLALYYRFQMLFIFILAFSALCFWWICASSDPSASYPTPWDKQGLIKASLRTILSASGNRSCGVCSWPRVFVRTLLALQNTEENLCHLCPCFLKSVNQLSFLNFNLLPLWTVNC